MSDYKSDFLRVLSERGYIHQVSDVAALDRFPTGYFRDDLKAVGGWPAIGSVLARLGAGSGAAPPFVSFMGEVPYGFRVAADGVQLVLLPVRILFAPVAVEPESSDRAVACREDFDTIAQILEISREVFVESRIAPIQSGVIEHGHDALGSAPFNEIADEIPLCRSVRHVIR